MTVMNMGLLRAIEGTQTGKVQLAVAGQMLKSNADHGAAIAKLIDSAQQNIGSLANVASHIGTNLNVSV
jgi:hypothetical protein